MARMKSGIDIYKAASSVEKTRRNPEAAGTADSGTGTAGSRKAEPKNPKSTKGSKAVSRRDVGKDGFGGADAPAAGPGFLKLTGEDATDEAAAGTTAGARAARLLLLLGKDEAAEVMARLSPEEAEEVARHIAGTRRVDSVEARALLDEFGERFAGVEPRRARGGVEAAREILTAAFGEDRAAGILATAVPESIPGPFAFLADLETNQLANLLRKENPRTMALVMAYIEPARASRLLEGLPDEERAAVVLRMARTERVSNDVIATVETALQEKLRLIGRDDSEEMDGRAALADILRFMDMGDERRLLDELEDSDPDIAEQVKEKLYTMDSVLHLRDRDLQGLLFDMDEKSIAMVLKGQAPEIRERILGALSSRRRILVVDEGDMMGPVPRSEADAAVREFLDVIRAGEEAGTYIVIREEEDLIE